MAKTQKAASAARPDTANLERLTQSQAAWLIGKPPIWLRDNSHLVGRNADGTYNARELLRAAQSEYVPAELPDAESEFVVRLGMEIAGHREGFRVVTIRRLEQIERASGAAGLAAVGAEILRQFRQYETYLPEPAPDEKPTPESIRERAAERTEAEIAGLDTWGADSDLRVVLVCDLCHLYRWGGRWKPQPIPRGFVSESGRCWECFSRNQ